MADAVAFVMYREWSTDVERVWHYVWNTAQM